MTRRRLPLMLALAGVLVILASVVAAAVVRSSDTATLALGERPGVPVVVTEPGVLDAVDPEVTVRATADDDEQVVLAVGRTAEVEAWLAGADHMRVTGLSSWEELTVEVVTAEPTDPAEEPTAPEGEEEPAGLPNPAGSDLWLVETVGTGSAELSWSDSPGRWSLVAATDGTGPAPEVELEWGRQVSTPWLVPGIVVGALLLAAGVTMIVLDVLAERERRRRDEARGHDEPPRSITDTDPGTGERLTRRQIREMEQAMARDGRNRPAGESVPPVPLATDDDATLPGAEPADAEQPATEPDAEPEQPEQPEQPERPEAEEPVVPAWLGSDPDEPQPAVETEPEPEPTDEPGPESTDEPDLSQEPEPDESADEGFTPAPPSWRSVWGFGSGPATPPTHPTDDDGEERR